jgi:hypothetical protein
MKKIWLAAAFLLATAADSAIALADPKEPPDGRALETIKMRFRQLMDLANRHDIEAIHDKFWQSPSALLVAKSAIPSGRNWAGFWGTDAIAQKLHDIAASGPVVK